MTAPALLAFALCAVHLLAQRMSFLRTTPRSAWLSFAGGMSLSYVFLHLLPEIGEGQIEMSREGEAPLFGFGLYAVALSGLLIVYLLERLLAEDREAGRDELNPEDETDTGPTDPDDLETAATPTFWLHLANFAVYNAIVGILLVVRIDETRAGLALFALAMGLHILVSDHGLNADFQQAWRRIGRWVLSGAVLSGLAIGYAAPPAPAWLDIITAFLGGSVILHVLKEDLPENRRSRVKPLLAGVLLFAALVATEARFA